MSKIHAIRLVNISYNNNAIRISDEIFHMKGESTLLSLQNGGGKSVLVQMLIAPFVHRRYRDALDRPFESYFTTARPSFILVEWALDHGAGYVMTGMMVRRRQEVDGDGNEDHENLEVVQFISEYRSACPQDIYHLPVVEKKKKEMILKSYAACRQLFDTYKKDPSVKFFCYDTCNSAQSRQYFNKLTEYQIYYKEWETIIKKINLKESGLSDLFADCKDEKGLVEKWLLDAVASKLNKEKDRMKEFQNIFVKYAAQYKDNKTKIRQRDIIRQFAEEAEVVMETADGYAAVENEWKAQQRRIGVFMRQLETAKAAAQKKQEELETEKCNISSEIDHLRYQQISGIVYEAMEEERYHRADREMIQLERDAKEREYEQAEYDLHLLELARQQQELEELYAEREQYRQQLAVINQREQDFGRERKNLGYTLRLYYEAARQQNREETSEAEKQRKKLEEQILAETGKAEALRTQIITYSARIGSMEARIQDFDGKEERYNSRYQPGFLRNILGEYEPAALEIRQQEYEKELENQKKSYVQMKQAAEDSRWKQKEQERNLEDARLSKQQKETELKEAEALCSRFRQEIKERRNIMRYFGLDEHVLYDTAKILNGAEKKLTEIELAKRRLEKEEDKLRRDYQRLTQGRVLELPKEFEDLLREAGISYVYGMEWLKKNQYTETENQKLVRSHPFLPYALLLSQRDMNKLRSQKETPYTAFPIPIIIREQLECSLDASADPLVIFSQVSFYILFNQHLLNEEKLQQMAADIEAQAAKKQEQIQQRREEYESYFEKKERLRGQTVTREGQEQAEKKREQITADIMKQDAEINRQKEEIERLSGYLYELQHRIQENVKQQSAEERRLEDLKELSHAYAAYKEEKRQLELLRQEQEQIKEKERLAADTAQKKQERAKKLDFELERLLRCGEQLADKAACYEQYGKDDTPERVEGKIEELEYRYTAITSRLSLRHQELEQLLHNVQKKLRRQEHEQTRCRKKYHIKEGGWKDVVYDAKTEEYQEQLLKQKEQQYELKKAQWNEADKSAALASQRLEQQRKLLLEKCEEAEPLPKEEIQPVDFESEIKQRRSRYERLEQAQHTRQQRIGWYEENLTALAEYGEYMPEDEAELWETLRLDILTDGQETAEYISQQIASHQAVVESMTGEELRRKKGMLVRDHNLYVEQRQARKDCLASRLNQMARREEFAADFYRKPIEAMLALTDHAQQVIRQMQITLQSYENLMEKIQVDINVVEEEKMRIAELLCAYIHEVHQNLGRIDQNSTISIRGRSIKMLKILLPDWEENLQMYQLRIQDFMDETTKTGISVLEANENIQEYIGMRLTTKNLYDAVAGIEHVQIRLYKIEAQREYPITWSQVARNSGGEGFLSAFIILTSLLYYMRRDESDLFAEYNEGKVLIMDNPFAQTNAAHLLVPLMDMAERTNTQLICLSGLGGESIYNRFHNIYVMNLVTANLRSGTRYLKAEHTRGEENGIASDSGTETEKEMETMLVSQIEVVEQQLLF